MLTHHVAFLVDNGLEALFAFYIVGIIGIVSLACKILGGVIVGQNWQRAHLHDRDYLLHPRDSNSYLISHLSNFDFALCICRFFGTGYAIVSALYPLITGDFYEGES